MFNTVVNRLEPFSREMMDKVCVKRDSMDETLFMTMFVLLYNRVNNLKIAYTTATTTEEPKIISDPNVYSVHWFINSESPDEILRPFKTQFKTIEKLPTHEKFLSDQLKQKIHIRYMPNENTVCVFVDKYTYPVWHCVPFILPKLYPVFKEKPLTKEETLFLESLTYKTSANYVTRITELTNNDEFRSYILKEQLDAFEKKLFEKKVEAAQKSLSEIDQKMQAALEEYRMQCEKRTEAIALVNGLKTMADHQEEHTELQDYLTKNPRICNVALTGSKISFIVKTFLAPHHIEEWDTMSKSKKIFELHVTPGSKVFDKTENVKLLLDGIFSENRCLKLKMCAYFKMDYFGSFVDSQSRYDFQSKDKELANYIPNPHLHFHNCFGQNKIAILSQLNDGDIVGAIECAIACAQRVNIHESMTFDPFVRYLLNTNTKILVTEDGTEMTPTEAVEYLKGHNNE